MNEKPRKNVSEEAVFTGRLFEVVHQNQLDGRNFEIARRAPGVRLIITDRDTQKILLTREFRQELQAWDFRLPGGKVFDSLAEYQEYRESGEDILDAALIKAKAEGSEEAGIQIDDLKLYKVSTLGATVEWDLYVFEVTSWQQGEGQALESGEVIEADNWFRFDEAESMILNGEMQEERIALVLLQWIQKQKIGVS